MIVNLKLPARGGRGAKEAAAVTGAVMRAVTEGAVDLTRTRVVGD